MTTAKTIKSAYQGFDNIKLHRADCMEIMAGYPDNYFDICVTSPPYDDLREYGDKFDAFTENKWQSIIRELHRILADGGVVVWNVADATKDGSESGTSFKQALFFMDCGFRLHDTMIWKKPNPIPRSHNRYEQEFEYMFVFSKGKPANWNPLKEPSLGAGAKQAGTIQKKADGNRSPKSNTGVVGEYKVKGNVWEFANSERSFHPAVFPRCLVDMHLASWAVEGCKMFEPFLGSGTSAIAAHYAKMGEFVGCELDQDYYAAACERVYKETRQQELF